MIYLDSSIITLPNLLDIDSSVYTIELRNNVTNEKVTLDASNLSDNELYYQFSLDSSSLSPNEYTITLFDSSANNLGTYLAQKGINKKEHTVFNNDTTYVQFEN